jgi:hypothetical protein
MPSDDTAETERQKSPHQGQQDTFPRFGAFQRKQMRESLNAGLPHRRLPLTEFLTLSAVWSSRTLAALFHAASAHRLRDLQSFSHRNQRRRPKAPLLSCHWRHTKASVRGAATQPTDGRTRRIPWLQSFAPARCPTLPAVQAPPEAAALLAFVPETTHNSCRSTPKGLPLGAETATRYSQLPTNTKLWSPHGREAIARIATLLPREQSLSYRGL